MKKIILLIIFLLISFLGSSINFVQAAPLIKGMKSEAIKELQQILKEDPAIYPEGLITGFFGPATEQAIKRLQRKYGLKPTGIVDEKTFNLIFPQIEKIEFVSPKENENWDRNQLHKIEWKVGLLENQSEEAKNYFWKNASLDLFREEESAAEGIKSSNNQRPEIFPPFKTKRFVKHIATVNLFNYSYLWKIPADIPNGENYLIRISVRPYFLEPYPFLPEKPITPEETPPLKRRNLLAESGKFKISGILTPPTPNNPDNNPELRKLLDLMKDIAQRLNEAIRILERITGPQILPFKQEGSNPAPPTVSPNL